MGFYTFQNASTGFDFCELEFKGWWQNQLRCQEMETVLNQVGSWSLKMQITATFVNEAAIFKDTH